jgi:hypothetical protein
VLDCVHVSHLYLIRTEASGPASAALTQKIPALIETVLDLLQASSLLLACGRCGWLWFREHALPLPSDSPS